MKGNQPKVYNHCQPVKFVLKNNRSASSTNAEVLFGDTMNRIRRLVFPLSTITRCLFLVSATLIVSSLSATLGLKTGMGILLLFVSWGVHELLLRSEVNSKTSLIGILTISAIFLLYLGLPLIVSCFFPNFWSKHAPVASPLHLLWFIPYTIITTIFCCGIVHVICYWPELKKIKANRDKLLSATKSKNS